MTNTTKNIHEGRNIKRFREMLGIKQDALAWQLGEDWNQQRISLLEQKETVDPALLQKISEVMKIPVDAFKNFDEQHAVNIIANTFHEGAVANNSGYFNCTFNPLDKLIEAYEEITRLNVELLKEKDVQIKLLQRLLEKK